MEEKTYKLLGGSGALNIAVGAVVLVSGIASGVLLIVNGARQLGTPGQTDFLRMQEMEFLRSSRLQIGNCVSEAFRKGDRRAQALHFYR